MGEPREKEKNFSSLAISLSPPSTHSLTHAQQRPPIRCSTQRAPARRVSRRRRSPSCVGEWRAAQPLPPRRAHDNGMNFPLSSSPADILFCTFVWPSFKTQGPPTKALVLTHPLTFAHSLSHTHAHPRSFTLPHTHTLTHTLPYTQLEPIRS